MHKGDEGLHTYDYSFLEGFKLPDNLTSLIACLHGVQKRLAKPGKTEPQAKAPGLPEIFRSLPLKDSSLSHAMDQISAAYEAASTKPIEPLLLVPCVTLDVLCTLPKDPASHSAAMELAKLLLCRSGYSMCRNLPLDKKISIYRYSYQRAFERSADHWELNGSAYIYYIDMFLSMLYLCCKELPSAPAPKRGTKRAAIEALVLQSGSPISKAEICSALPDVSPTTVEAVLGDMVRSGSIRKVGAARAVRYIVA